MKTKISSHGIDVRITIEPEGLAGWYIVSVYIDGERIATQRTDGEPYGPEYTAVVKGDDRG